MPTPEFTAVDDPLFTVAEAAVYLSISRHNLYKMTREGAIAVTRIGGALRFRRSHLDRFIEEHTYTLQKAS